MDKALKEVPEKTAEGFDADLKLVFDFLDFSTSDGPSGAVLHDHILTSLALALHRTAEAH